LTYMLTVLAAAKAKFINVITIPVIVAILGTIPMSRDPLDKETPEERTQRHTVLATGMLRAASLATCTGEFAAKEGCERRWYRSRDDLIMHLITQGRYESNFAKRIHEGKCRPNECDGQIRTKTKDGKIVRSARAKTVWQLQWHKLYNRKQWLNVEGLDQERTTRAAWFASKWLSVCLKACGNDDRRLTAMYKSGRTCKFKGIAAKKNTKDRADYFWALKSYIVPRILKKMKEEEKKAPEKKEGERVAKND